MALIGLRWRARRRPDDGNNWLALSKALLEAGDLAEARDAARQAARWPVEVNAALDLAQRMEDAGDYAAARSLLEAATRSDPQNPDGYGFLGLFLLRAGLTDDAIDALRMAVKLSPGIPEGHIFLAEALRTTGALGEALEHVKTAISLDPSSVTAQVRLGRIYASQGNADAALGAFRAAYALDPQDFEAALALGSALGRAGQPRESISIFQVLLERDSACIEALINCGMAHAQLDEAQPAMRLLREAIRLRPDVPEAHCDLGIVQMQLKQVDAAIFSFRSAVALAPDSPEAHFQLGQALRERGARDAAGVHLEAAMRNSSPADETHQAAAAALRELSAVAGKISLMPEPPPDLDDDDEPPPPLANIVGRGRTGDFESSESLDDILDEIAHEPELPAAEMRPRGTLPGIDRVTSRPTPVPVKPALVNPRIPDAPRAEGPSAAEDEPWPGVRVSRTPTPISPGAAQPPAAQPTPPPASTVDPAAARPAGPQPVVTVETSEATAAFAGNLKMFTLPNLLEFLRLNNSTGTLFLQGKRGTGEIKLRHGLLVAAGASRAPRLGEILVKTGQLRSEDLERFIVLQRNDEGAESLGALLLEKQAINERGLRAAIIAQIHAGMAELISWDDGNFWFHSGAVEVPGDHGGMHIELSTEMVVLEALRRVDELRRG